MGSHLRMSQDTIKNLDEIKKNVKNRLSRTEDISDILYTPRVVTRETHPLMINLSNTQHKTQTPKKSTANSSTMKILATKNANGKKPVKSQIPSNNTPVYRLPELKAQEISSKAINKIELPTAPTAIKKLSSKLAARHSPERLSKNLVTILKTLKKEYDNIENTSQFASPSLKSMQNPVMLYNNKTVGPINKNHKPDGVVNLDELLRKRRNITPTFPTPSISWSERSAAVKEKLDEIIKKHTNALDNLEKMKERTAIINTVHPSTSMKAPVKENYSYKHTTNINLSFNSATTSNNVNNSTSTSINNTHNNNNTSSNLNNTSTSNNITPIITAVSRLEGSQPRSNTTNTSLNASKVSSTPRYTATPVNQKPVPRMSFSPSTHKRLSNMSSLAATLHKDDVKMLREKVDGAIKANKTFTVCGNYYSVRNALNNRGWVEKLHPAYIPLNCDANLFRRLQTLSIPELGVGLKDKDLGHIYRTIIISKMIGNQPVAFYWDLNRDTYRNNADNLKNAYINFISKSRFNYANKQGLCESSKQAYWFNNPGVSFLRTPRSYSLVASGGPDDFINDFKITAAMSFLKWILFVHESNVSKLISDTGKVPLTYFHFALRECAKFVKKLKHEDIDTDIPVASEREWQEFLDYFYKAIHVGNHFKQSGLETEMSMVHKSKAMVKKLKEVFPQMDMDGYMNIWILKPSYGSRGIGIHFCRTLQYVLKVMRDNKQNAYVIQKYIERPLLIHNTKFDIRQWFLISSTSPLTIWIYKECYLRFSSQTYNLRKLHESIHLTNNSVQSKYQNGNRDPCLPPHNMWFLRDFKQHLENLGYPDVYSKIIYPGMKECITAALLTNIDQIYRTSKAFELHGADFMITEDFQPWLIEINSKPALNPSTPVTSKLCPAVLEDVIKVIVDYSKDVNASTGNFELMYREKEVKLPNKLENAALMVHGKPIENDYFLTPEQVKDIENAEDEKQPSSDSINVITSPDYMKFVGKEMKKTLKQLLSVIEKERSRRKLIQEKSNKETEMDYCCEEMDKLKSNVKEIQEIFKQEMIKTPSTTIEMAKSTPSVGNSRVHTPLKEATDSVLTVNAKKVENALDTLITKKTDSNTINSMFKIIDSLNVINT